LRVTWARFLQASFPCFLSVCFPDDEARPPKRPDDDDAEDEKAPGAEKRAREATAGCVAV